MRTTITLDDDVASMLERVQREEKKPFKRVVNDLLRMGLVSRKSEDRERISYSTPELDAGPCNYADVDNIADVLAVAEGEDFS